MYKTSLLAAALVTSLFSVSAQAGQDLAQVIASDFRQAENVGRDIYRHPAQTLAFFEIEANQTVIELWPGGGWYAEILGPYLAEKGQYIGANFDTMPAQDTPGTKYRADVGKKFEDWIKLHKAQLGQAGTVTFDPPAHISLGQDGSADRVLTFRNLHNWAMTGQLEQVFASAHSVLKEGGILGVVEHRANPGMSAQSGYMEQEKMVEIAQKAGFVLAASSEINANPKDSKDYENGVWTLPPRLALGEQDKAKYLAIGESDRMTLKFVKKPR
jgi:predicted methyltransferase